MPHLLCHLSFKYLPDGLVKRLALTAWNSHWLSQGKLLFPALYSEMSNPHLLALPLFKQCSVLTFSAYSLWRETSCPAHSAADHQICAVSVGSLPDSPLGQSVLLSYSSLNSPASWSYYWLSFSPQNEHVTARFYFMAWAIALLIKE